MHEVIITTESFFFFGKLADKCVKPCQTHAVGMGFFGGVNCQPVPVPSLTPAHDLHRFENP